MKNLDLKGAFEERYTIGHRVEIEGSKFTYLWRGKVILETTFKSKQTSDNRIDLALKFNELRNNLSDNEPYATIEEVYFENGKLYVNVVYKIAGLDKFALERTENLRYGNYVIDDKYLKELNGKWTDENGYEHLEIKNGVISDGREKRKIHIMHYPENNVLFIKDDDPSREGVLGYITLKYLGNGLISGTIFVCDADPIEVTLRKEK